ncbi:MAG TPA: helix-hairpin-helix domain-containing protein [Longimicrobiales bacterium]|nr:helix-hairpin-helix domain-containing protein [Longimicrobiales bacterium]
MKLSRDESRALAFVLGLVGLSAGVRYVRQPPPVAFPASMNVDAASLEKASKAALERDRKRGKPLGKGETIDVNRAAAEELERLPGVGPSLAQRIVDERERNGAYDSAADLRAVRGMGPKMLANIAPRLAFGGGSGLRPRVHAAVAAAEEGARPGTPSTDATGDAPSVEPRASRPRRPHSPTPPLAPSGTPTDGKVALNRATAADLEKLPGIGPALARRIVAYRDSAGPFRALADLDRVKGVGPALLKRLQPLVDP